MGFRCKKSVKTKCQFKTQLGREKSKIQCQKIHFLARLFQIWGVSWGVMPSQFKNPFKKNHALAQSLLSRVFSWDVVDVGFPTC
jgi:hypothetical protein